MPSPLTPLHENLQHCKALLVILSEKVAGMEAELAQLSQFLPVADEDADEKSLRQSSRAATQQGESTNLSRFVLSTEADTTKYLQSVVFALEETSNPTQFVANHGVETTNRENSVLSALAVAPIPADSPLLPSEQGLRAILRREEFRMGKASAQRVAKVLLRICTHPEVSNQTYLAKMLGISSSGMSKHMEGLQRRGLVERRGYREYALTPKAAGYLQRAVEAEA